MKFAIGDPVRVINRRCSVFDAVGIVTALNTENRHLPSFVVESIVDHPLYFNADELILAEIPTASDTVNHPAHYGGAADPYEVIKVAEAWGFDKDAYLFNVLKYIARAGKKGATLQDHKKARFYLDRKITRLEESE